MKKLAIFALTAIMALGFAACDDSGNGSAAKKHDTPTKVVKKYLDLVVAKNYEEAIKLCDGAENASEEDIKSGAAVTELFMELAGGLERYEILGEEIDESGETATVKVKYSFGKNGEDTEECLLAKKDGVWRILME